MDITLKAKVIIGIVIILVSWLIATRNSFAKLCVKIDEALADIDVVLQQRWDCVQSVYESAVTYINKEEKILLKTTQYRSGMTPEEMAQANEEIKQTARNISAVAENYPELKSSELFLNLQNIIKDTEDELQASRRIYNSNVSIYNQKVLYFPNSMLAKLWNYKQKGFFKADEEARKRPQIKTNI